MIEDFKLQIWDTSGHETFRSLNFNLYKNIQIAMVVFSLNDQ